MDPWKTISRRTILQHSKYLTVEEHVVELPDGRRIEDWPWIITPNYINVVAETEAGTFLCFRQVKYALDGVTMAVVGGYLEPGEEPLAAARRELLEETGYQASRWIDLGHYNVGANRGFATANLYFARGARPVTMPNSDDLEEQELIELTRSELKTALMRGEFQSLAWTTAVAMALLWLEDGGD
ncbi:MAG: NUDIX hydrolase [Chloroflexota bacterium]|nr:NUDIX hydrolase [Chloroflexota bacterium]